MKAETRVTWEERNKRGTELRIQTGDWRLECNAQATDMDCQKLLAVCNTDTLVQILRQAMSSHVPTWEAALQSANPPDEQMKKDETEYR